MKAPVGTAIKKASSLLDTGVGMAHAGQKDDSSERLSIAAAGIAANAPSKGRGSRSIFITAKIKCLVTHSAYY